MAINENYMKKTFAYIMLFALAAFLSGCDEYVQEYDAGKCAEEFTAAYCNYDFAEAQKHVTSDSEKWLRFMASNITQQDIDSINDTQPATVEVEDMEISESMTEAKATVSVYGWMRKHDIGSIPKMTDECQLTVAMVKEGKQWKVRMEAPLQSGMQSRGSSQDEQ